MKLNAFLINIPVNWKPFFASLVFLAKFSLLAQNNSTLINFYNDKDVLLNNNTYYCANSSKIVVKVMVTAQLRGYDKLKINFFGGEKEYFKKQINNEYPLGSTINKELVNFAYMCGKDSSLESEVLIKGYYITSFKEYFQDGKLITEPIYGDEHLVAVKKVKFIGTEEWKNKYMDESGKRKKSYRKYLIRTGIITAVIGAIIAVAYILKM